ncbi:hypothetical protein CCP3SC15_2860004 [Gammaproteobacteria bacterium]
MVFRTRPRTRRQPSGYAGAEAPAPGTRAADGSQETTGRAGSWVCETSFPRDFLVCRIDSQDTLNPSILVAY